MLKDTSRSSTKATMLAMPLIAVLRLSLSEFGLIGRIGGIAVLVAILIIGIVRILGAVPGVDMLLPQHGQKTASEGTSLPQYGHEGPLTPALEETSGSIDRLDSQNAISILRYESSKAVD